MKLATSLDGRIAAASGESRWITSEAARAETHRMRARAGFVMIGSGTARADNPSLTARTEPAPLRQPARVVVTSRFDIPFESALFESLPQAPLIVFGGERTGPARQAILEGTGARVEQAPLAGGGLDLNAVMARLATIGPGAVFVEGGGTLAASLIAADLVDTVEWFRAPIVLGAEGKPAVGALSLARLADAPRWKRVAVRELGPDLWETYERIAGS